MNHKCLDQVISELQAIRAEHGNIAVVVRGPYEYESGIAPEITYKAADEIYDHDLGLDEYCDIVGYNTSHLWD